MKRVVNFFDPYHQSFLCFHWNFWTVFIVIFLCAWMTEVWNSGWMRTLMENVFVYFPNYLTHEMAGHNFIGRTLWYMLYGINPAWAKHALGQALTVIIAGNAVETLIPLGLYLGSLRLQGGRYFSPILLYWLSTTFYGAGEYIMDAKACSMPLTSSDMMTNYAPGEICGDWHNILEPLGLLNYDQILGTTVLALGMFCFVMAVWSLYEAWFNSEKYMNFNRHSEF